MQLGDLDQLVGILSADMHLKMVPGYSWIPDRLTRKITYPRAQLMTMDDNAATGWIFRCVEHCISTFGDLDAYNVGVDAALTIRDIAGVEVIHPRFFLHVVLMAERERVEAIARRRARNLENTYLPRRWQRFRETERVPDRIHLATISPMENPADYWERVGLAVALLAANAITAAELPSDMHWSPDVVARIQRIPTIATYDEVLAEIEALMPAFVRSQLEEHAAPAESATDESASPADAADEPIPESSDNDEPSSQPNASSDDADASDESNDDESTEDDGDDADGSAAADSSDGGSAESQNGPSPTDAETSADDSPSESGDSSEGAAGAESGQPPEDGEDADAETEPNSSTEPTSETSDTTADNANDSSGGASGDPPTSAAIDGAGASGEATDTVHASGTSQSTADDQAGESLADLIGRIAPELLKALEEALESEPDGPLEIDFINDDAAADPDRPTETYAPNTEDEFRKNLVPAWGAVSRSSINRQLREPLRRTLLKHLIDNEVGELETGHRSGRLDVRAVARPDPQAHPFRRRQAKADQSYAVGLIADASGSMNASCYEIDHDATVFGEGHPRRWHLTTYLAVALTEALSVIPNTQLTIVTYDTHVSFVKPHAMPLTPEVRQKILRGIIARGDNDDAGALTAAIDDLIRATNTTKLLFHLTDGEFCSGQSAIQYQLNRAKKNGITVVFLTLAIEPTSARRFVDAELADRVDPDTIGPVINKHLTRMLRGQRFAA